MKLLQLYFSFLSIRVARKSLRGTVFLAAIVSVSMSHAQNPSFAGKEFKRVWVGGTVPPGASGSPSITETYLNAAGVVIRSRATVNGFYFVDGNGAYTCVDTGQPEFSDVAWFEYLGSKPDGSVLICPVNNLLTIPCQMFNGSGTSSVSSPTPEQRLSRGNYFDGRMVYTEHAGLGAVNIWYHTEGSAPVLWLDNTDFAKLATTLDYDGDTLAFAEGAAGTFNIWRRASDGTLTRIIGNADALPGVAGMMYTGTPSDVNTEVDQGRVYILGVGTGFPAPQSVFSTADGVTFDVIATTGQVVPGLTAVTITSMQLKQVRDGKVWLKVVQSDGDTVLYQIVGGVWTRVAGKLDSYDGQSPVAFDVFEHSMFGDRVVVAVTYFDFSVPGFYVTDLYVNGDLPGFAAVPAGLAMQLVSELNGNLTVSATGDPGVTNTLQGTLSLTNTVWQTVGTVIADGAGRMQWTLSPTNNARFFRLVE